MLQVIKLRMKTSLKESQPDRAGWTMSRTTSCHNLKTATTVIDISLERSAKAGFGTAGVINHHLCSFTGDTDASVTPLPNHHLALRCSAVPLHLKDKEQAFKDVNVHFRLILFCNAAIMKRPHLISLKSWFCAFCQICSWARSGLSASAVTVELRRSNSFLDSHPYSGSNSRLFLQKCNARCQCRL